MGYLWTVRINMLSVHMVTGMDLKNQSEPLVVNSSFLNTFSLKRTKAH